MNRSLRKGISDGAGSLTICFIEGREKRIENCTREFRTIDGKGIYSVGV